MRAAYALIGLGFVIIFGGLYFFTDYSRTSSDISKNPVTIDNATTTMSSTLSLTSSEFEGNTSIPSRYTCDGDQVNPPLTIKGVPAEAKSLVLIMDDPDVPKALKPDGVFDHWVLFNIPTPPAGGTLEIATGMTIGTPGANGAGKNQYIGPCPPTQYEPSEHRYFFKLYALDTELALKEGASKADVEKAMSGHVITETRLVGRYKRK